MFRNLTIFRFPEAVDLDALEAALGTAVLKPVGPMERESSGFVSPFGRDSVVLSHAVGRVVWLTVGGEKRLLPTSVLTVAWADKLKEHEAKTGAAPSGKTRKQIKDDVIAELLPRAFVQHSRVDMSIDRTHSFLAIDTTSRKQAEAAVSEIRSALGSFPAMPLNAERSMSVLATSWLAGEPLPEGFVLGEEVELDDGGGGEGWKGVRADLTSDEVVKHLEAGKRVVRVGLVYQDRVAFTIGEDLVIRKFRLTDVAMEQLGGFEAEDLAAELDARYCLAAAEIRRLFLGLHDVLSFTPVGA